jgi:hypothetical protein
MPFPAPCQDSTDLRIGIADDPHGKETRHMTEHYIDSEAYIAAANAIARRWNLAVDDVKIAMAEGGNVWPETIRRGVSNG